MDKKRLTPNSFSSFVCFSLEKQEELLVRRCCILLAAPVKIPPNVTAIITRKLQIPILRFFMEILYIPGAGSRAFNRIITFVDCMIYQQAVCASSRLHKLVWTNCAGAGLLFFSLAPIRFRNSKKAAFIGNTHFLI